MPRPAEEPIGGEEVHARLQVAVGKEGPVRIVTAAGELDHDTADELRRALALPVDNGIRRILVDFGDLQFCDSTGLNLLLRARLDAEAAGLSLEVADLQPAVARLFAITGVDTVMRIHPDRGAALKVPDAGPGDEQGPPPATADEA
ncbi:STAS domain-containing protein [Kitasatospora sp. A2-31]|uniref:STAS domain-containing protein n=1 Tax=Kitasatospora sp. A2-31 TaxID=2916414 RepID=UPI001EEBC85B|nr:STAS domain-containing protein [Kitasatospora sp. A2-31]MCG6494216.1 STAS domain-containing protein [Kitasatospora sp. A2-31]